MRFPPFRGRRPVFIGDDVTDHAAFRVLPEFGGTGYSVGHKFAGLAGYFTKPQDVREWLYQMADAAADQA
jgi:trehalose 6-phosphate phosphatase